MKCPGCQTEILEKGTRFCPSCGFTINSNKAEDLPKISILPKKQAVVFILGLVMIMAVVTAAFMIKPMSPDAVAENFLKALKTGQYENAYNLLDDRAFNGNPFLTKENFQQAFSSAALQDYKLDVPDNVQSTAYANRASFKTMMKTDKQQKTISISLVNNDDKKTDWKIDPAVFIVSTRVYTLPNIKVTINGQDTYSSGNIQMFADYPMQVKFENPDIKTVERSAKAGENINVTKFQPSDALLTQATDLVDKYNKADIQAMKELNISYYQPYVTQNSFRWTTLSNNINMYKSSNTSIEKQLMDVKYLDLVFGNSLSNLYFNVDEKWHVTTKNKDGKITSDTTKDIRWRYELYKQADGKWLIANSIQR
jgi:hypothetical protein